MVLKWILNDSTIFSKIGHSLHTKSICVINFLRKYLSLAYFLTLNLKFSVHVYEKANILPNDLAQMFHIQFQCINCKIAENIKKS